MELTTSLGTTTQRLIVGTRAGITPTTKPGKLLRIEYDLKVNNSIIVLLSYLRSGPCSLAYPHLNRAADWWEGRGGVCFCQVKVLKIISRVLFYLHFLPFIGLKNAISHLSLLLLPGVHSSI